MHLFIMWEKALTFRDFTDNQVLSVLVPMPLRSVKWEKGERQNPALTHNTTTHILHSLVSMTTL